MNFLIQLHENVEGGISTPLFRVSDKQLEKIKENKNLGGFNRYEIDVIEETLEPITITCMAYLNNFERHIFGNFIIDWKL